MGLTTKLVDGAKLGIMEKDAELTFRLRAWAASLNSAMAKEHKNKRQVAEHCRVPESTVQSWLHAECIPEKTVETRLTYMLRQMRRYTESTVRIRTLQAEDSAKTLTPQEMDEAAAAMFAAGKSLKLNPPVVIPMDASLDVPEENVVATALDSVAEVPERTDGVHTAVPIPIPPEEPTVDVQTPEPNGVVVGKLRRKTVVTAKFLLELYQRKEATIDDLVAGLVARDALLTNSQYGMLLRIARISEGMSLAEVAKLLGVDGSTLGYWERGVHLIGTPHVANIAELFPVLAPLRPPSIVHAERAEKFLQHPPPVAITPVDLQVPVEEPEVIAEPSPVVEPPVEEIMHVVPSPKKISSEETSTAMQKLASQNSELFLAVVRLAVRHKNGDNMATLELFKLASTTSLTINQLVTALEGN